MEPTAPARFWLETAGRPPRLTVTCCCGWRRTATTDAKAEALAQEHTRAHEALAAAGVA